MRYRALTSTGDYSFGNGAANFLVNSPETVGQAVLTRLKLWSGEWFLDKTEGTPYFPDVIGEHTQSTYDIAIRQRILQTQGVLKITAYSSSVVDRALSVTATIDTIYGETTISATNVTPGVL